MIVVPWELVECTLIKSVKCRAGQDAQDWGDALIDQQNDWSEIRHESFQYRRNPLLRSLEEEAAQVITLK